MRCFCCGRPPPRAEIFEVWTETSLRFANLGRAQASTTSTGLATLDTSSSASLHLSTITLPGVSLQATVPLTDPLSAPRTAVLFSVNQRPDLQGGGAFGNVSGAIAGSGALTPNTLPHTGAATVCLLLLPLPPCQAQFTVPVGATDAGARVGLGVGGLWTLGTGTVVVTLVGAPYTVGTVSVPNRTEHGEFSFVTGRGFAHGPLSLTSSTAQASGVLQIVTAQHVYLVGQPGGSQDATGLISRTLVHVIPEPGLLALFGSGAALIAWLGRQRRWPDAATRSRSRGSCRCGPSACGWRAGRSR